MAKKWLAERVKTSEGDKKRGGGAMLVQPMSRMAEIEKGKGF